MRKTKIVCTLGPATEDVAVIKELIEAGMNVARINFSHGDQKTHMEKIKNLKAAREQLSAPVALMLDTKGPEIRIKKFSQGSVRLRSGDMFTLTTQDVAGDENIVSVTYKNLPEDLDVGARVLVDDGLIEMRVEELTDTQVRCRVENGGRVSDNKGVNVPDVFVKLPALTEKDIVDLKFGIEAGFDFVAASFIRTAEDIRKIRSVLNENGGENIHILAKIENRSGVDNIDDILDVADGIMVARGDLGVEIPPEEVPQVQKMLISKANRSGKPVITATHMLESMTENPRPTRAEVNDVANSIYDSSDAVMLSGETAMGKYPVQAVELMARIAMQAEGSIQYEQLIKKFPDQSGEITNAIGHAAATIAAEMEACCIAAVTHTGFTPRMVSRFRPDCPIIACTMFPTVWRQLNLVWGCVPVFNDRAEESDDEFNVAMQAALDSGFAKTDDLVVMSMGLPVGVAGSTNTLRVARVQ